MPRATKLASPPRDSAAPSVSVGKCAETIRRSVLEIIRRETMSTFDPEQAPGTFGRLPIVVSFRILPVTFDGTSIRLDGDHSKTGVALTRDLSFEGVAFEHPAPLDGRHALAFFSALESMDTVLLFERLWSKELRPIEYLSGGRFTGVVSLRDLPRSLHVA